MRNRRLSTDVPSHNPRLQRGRILTRIRDDLYQIEVGEAIRLASYSWGQLPIDIDVDISFHPERGPQWRIEYWNEEVYYDIYHADLAEGDWSWGPASSRVGSELLSNRFAAPATWADLRAGTGAGGAFQSGANGDMGAGVQIGSEVGGVFNFMARGITQWALGSVPLGITIKRAQLIAYPMKLYAANPDNPNTNIPGAQSGWIKSDKPVANDGTVDFSSIADWTLPADVSLITDLADLDALSAIQPVETDILFNGYLGTRPAPIVWNFTALGVSHLQDAIDNPATPSERHIKLTMLFEWDRADVNPHPGYAGGTLLWLSNGKYTDDGMLMTPMKIRLFI